MRQKRKAGERAVVDYAGKRARVVDPTIGEVIDVEVCVALPDAWNLTYAEATWSQKREQGWRSAKGLQRLAKKYETARLEGIAERSGSSPR